MRRWAEEQHVPIISIPCISSPTKWTELTDVLVCHSVGQNKAASETPLLSSLALHFLPHQLWHPEEQVHQELHKAVSSGNARYVRMYIKLSQPLLQHCCTLNEQCHAPNSGNPLLLDKQCMLLVKYYMTSPASEMWWMLTLFATGARSSYEKWFNAIEANSYTYIHTYVCTMEGFSSEVVL